MFGTGGQGVPYLMPFQSMHGRKSRGQKVIVILSVCIIFVFKQQEMELCPWRTPAQRPTKQATLLSYFSK